MEVARTLAGLNIEAVYSSDLKRAVDTARPIARDHGVEVTPVRDLREIDQGQWTGLTLDEIARRWPERWGPARHYTARPGGESPDQVRYRAVAAVMWIVREHPRGSVVIVSHGGTMRWLVAEALGYDDRRSSTLRGVPNGGIVSFDAELTADGELIMRNLRRLDHKSTDANDPNQ